MMNKNVIMIFGFVFSTLISGIVHADVIEDNCARDSGYNERRDKNKYERKAIVAAYENCVAENRRMLSEQAAAPKHPGTPPVYNCEPLNLPTTQTDYGACRSQYEISVKKYNLDLAAYQTYAAGHPNMNNKGSSTTAMIEAVAHKQQNISDRLGGIADGLKYTGGITAGIGAGIIVSGITTGAAPLIYKGSGLVVLGICLTIYGKSVQRKSDKLAADKVQTCIQLNKLLTKPVPCPDVKDNTGTKSNFMATNYGFKGSNGTSDIPAFIDSTSGKCKAPVSAECAAIVKNSPKDCFKANSKGVSCMAGGQTKPLITELPNEKISANINGKQLTVGEADFADEASMVKAGFTPAQAKGFFEAVNDPNSILALSGLDARGELRESSEIPSSSYVKSFSSGGGAGSSPAASEMKSKKDEYGPVQDVARTPASAEGLTKDYQGEKIGAEGDDVFKMINRRYILKQKQNIFLEQ